MAVPDLYRKYKTAGDGSSGQVFSVPFGIDSSDEIYVYEGDDLAVLGTDYNVTLEGIPTSPAEAEGFSVTWIGTTIAATVYSFFRMSDRTQKKTLPTSTSGDYVEKLVRRMSYQCQESIFATLEVLDAGGTRIQTLAAPIASEDIATHLYTQARYSSAGFLPPPVEDTDEDKMLYSQDQQRLVWKDGLDVPSAPSGTKVLRVKQDGSTSWESEPTYAPTLPVFPSFLSVDSGGSAIEWREVSDFSEVTDLDENQSIVSQHGGSVAWENVTNLPPIPPISNAPAKNYILTLWSNGDITTVESTVEPAKTTYIQNSAPTTNTGSSTLLKISSSGTARRGILIEVDLTSLGITPSNISSAFLSLHKQGGGATAGRTGTMCIGRLTQSWTETGATYNTYDGTNAWPGGVGAFNDVDYDLQVYPSLQETLPTMPAAVYYDNEITYLVKDAIENRNGLLSIYMFWKDTVSPTVTANYYSDDNGSNKPTIKINHTSTGRQSKWLAVAWGNTTVEPITTDDTEFLDLFTDAAGHHDPLQNHLHRFWNVPIVHNLGLGNLLGVSSIEMNKSVSGSEVNASPDEGWSTGIDVLSDINTAQLYYFYEGRDFFGEDHLIITNFTTSFDVAYTIWSPYSEEGSVAAGGEGGGACG